MNSGRGSSVLLHLMFNLHFKIFGVKAKLFTLSIHIALIKRCISLLRYITFFAWVFEQAFVLYLETDLNLQRCFFLFLKYFLFEIRFSLTNNAKSMSEN